MTRPKQLRRPDYDIPGQSPDCTFVCVRCGRTVLGAPEGSEHRNHCPHCLWSRHVDLRVGDRRASCKGDMEPIAVWIRGNGEWAIVHRCRRCGTVRTNRIAGDDNELALMSLAARPIANPPFPLDHLASGPLRGVRQDDSAH